MNYPEKDRRSDKDKMRESDTKKSGGREDSSSKSSGNKSDKTAGSQGRKDVEEEEETS
jgi:hypothetical protein